MMEYHERINRQIAYLQTIKKGDTVAVMTNGGYSTDLRQVKIAKVTKTQFVSEAASSFLADRYNRVTGDRIEKSSRYQHQIIDPAWADEIREEREKRNAYQALVGKVQGFDFNKYRQDDSDLLQKAVDFLTALEEERKARRAAEDAEYAAKH